MTLSLRRLVPIASGALLFLLSGCEETQLSHYLQEGDSNHPGLDYGAILGETAAVEAATLPDPNALYNAAVTLGGDAQQAADRARSAADWERAAMGWERALNFLKAIPQGSPMYSSARAKIIDYERRLDSALGQVRRASADPGDSLMARRASSSGNHSGNHSSSPRGRQSENHSSPSSPLATVSSTECQVAAPGGADILLSDLQLASRGGDDWLIGCITNRTRQPISAIALTYSHRDGEAAGHFHVPLQFNANANADSGQAHRVSLAPGETLVFQQNYGIEPEVDEILLESATWTIGHNLTQPQTQEAALAVTVTRE